MKVKVKGKNGIVYSFEDGEQISFVEFTDRGTINIFLKDSKKKIIAVRTPLNEKHITRQIERQHETLEEE